MNYRRLCERIRNLDRLYGKWDEFSRAAFNEADKEAQAGLRKVARSYRRKYDRLVADRRRVTA